MKALKIAAWLEGTTLILLLMVAVPLKYWGGDPTLVRLLGPIHGIAFLGYLHQVARSASQGLIGWKPGLVFALASFVPGGTFVAIRWTEK